MTWVEKCSSEEQDIEVQELHAQEELLPEEDDLLIEDSDLLEEEGQELLADDEIVTVTWIGNNETAIWDPEEGDDGSYIHTTSYEN